MCRRSAHLRSAPIRLSANRLCSREHAPVGFCCGGFSSTAGYDSGERGSTCVEATVLLQRLIKSSKRDPFLSGRSGKFFSNFPWQAFRLRREASIATSVNPPAVALKRRVTAPLADPLAGRVPVRAATGMRIIHASQTMSRLSTTKAFAACMAVEKFSTVWKTFSSVKADERNFHRPG